MINKKIFIIIFILLSFNLIYSQEILNENKVLYYGEKEIIFLDNLPKSTESILLEVKSLEGDILLFKTYDEIGFFVEVDFVPYDFFGSDILVEVSFLNFEGELLDKKSLNYSLEDPYFSLNIFFCSEKDCLYIERKNTFNVGEDIFINNFDFSEDVLYNVLVYKNSSFYDGFYNVSFPFKINLEEGIFSFEISTFYNDSLFISNEILNTIVVSDENISLTTNWESHFENLSKENPYFSAGETQDNRNNFTSIFNKVNYTWLYFIGLILILFLIYLFLFKRKNKKNNLDYENKISNLDEKDNLEEKKVSRREKRHSREE